MLRRSSLPSVAVVPINEPFYYKAEVDWPEAGVVSGLEYLIQPGPTFKGDIIALLYEGQSYLCQLIERDPCGNLQVYSHRNRRCDLKCGSFLIEGRVVVDCSRQPNPPKQPVIESSLIAIDDLLSWRNDEHGSNFGISLQWIKLTGQTPREIKDVGWLAAVHPDDRERVVRTRDAGIKSGKLYSTDYRLHLLTGGYIPVHTYSNPIIGNNSKIIGWKGAAQIKK